MVSAQEQLDKSYPKEKRASVKKLDISNKNLTGSLIISDFSQLEGLDCFNNNLTSLIVNNCEKLKEIHCYNNNLTILELNEVPLLEKLSCSDNQLISFDFLTGLNQKSLIFLSIRNNKIVSDLKELTPLLGKFNNLQELWLSNNPITGSCQSLQHCQHLRGLRINNTKLATGLEYLPESLEKFYCQETELPESLEKFGKSNKGDYISFLKTWQKEFQFWKNKDFTNQQIREWIKEIASKSGLGFVTEFSDYLKQKDCQPNTPELKKIITNESWQDIHQNFNYQLRKEWEEREFTYDQTKEWLDAGTKIDDHLFVVWLKDIKKYTPRWISDYQEDYQTLSESFKKYGLCLECSQPNTGEQWCQSCNAPHIKKNFVNWASGNPKIDEFIQKYQLEATDADKFLEWIPYEQFANIEYLAEGGFGKVYKAQWTTGNIHHWDQKNRQWQREKDYYYEDKDKKEKDFEQNKDKYKKCKGYREVVLKILNESQDNTDFLQETANHKIIDDWFNNIVPCYGISQDPNTKNCLIVMRYMPEGNLQKYLSNLRKNSNELKEWLSRAKKLSKEIKVLREQIEFKEEKRDGSKSFHQIKQQKFISKQQKLDKINSEIVELQEKLSLQNKFSQLLHIIQGLKDIHQKNLVHHDFHSGNILKGIEKTSCLITDLGLCRPVDETSREKVFGVLPYVAPEVLQSQPYTQASDIYSFGIIAYELFSGLPPYYDRVHDVKLGIEICQGLRPQFQIKVPQLLEDLIKKCWDTDPSKRLTANELEKTLRTWQAEINDYHKNTEFKNQLQEAEKFNQTLSDEIRFPNYQIHHEAIYTSKLLPTEEITQLMQNLNFQTKTLELNEHLTQAKQLAKEITMEQKYNDFKKVLKLVLEKSDELETIITTDRLNISQEMKETLTKIKELKNKSQEKDSVCQELVRKKLVKEQELADLKNIVVINNYLEEDDLEDLLEDQDQAIKNTNEKTTKKIERTKKRLAEKITEIAINQLCQLQTEITQLELKLNQNIDQSTRQLTRIINNIQIGDISFDNVQIGGAVAIGIGQISDGVNLNINNNQQWININPNFTPTLINQWKIQNFTYQECKEWMDIILPLNQQTTEIHQVEFYAWLRDTKQLTAKECLNYHNINQLKREYQAQLAQTQIQIPSKSNCYLS